MISFRSCVVYNQLILSYYKILLEDKALVLGTRLLPVYHLLMMLGPLQLPLIEFGHPV